LARVASAALRFGMNIAGEDGKNELKRKRLTAVQETFTFASWRVSGGTLGSPIAG